MESSSAHAKRVLTVEDEPAICDLCRRVLTSEGFGVDIATNGRVAQDMIADKQYNVLLLDIKMAIMDGKELYQWLQEKHPQLASRVIFTTGSVTGKDTTTFIEQTGRPYLPKPFTPDELKTIITETLKTVEK